MSKIKRPSSAGNRQSYRGFVVARFPNLCAELAAQYAAGECSLQEAVDWMQDWAFTRGVVELIGQDEVQRIMAEAVAPHRKDLAP